MSLHVPARDLPIPKSISTAAQAIMARPRFPEMTYPALDDKKGWHAYVASIHRMMLPVLQARADSIAADVEKLDVDGVGVFDVRPRAVSIDERTIILNIHGGGFIVGAGEFCRYEAVGLADDLQARVWSVDYRSPPDFPFPVPLDDCLTVYKALLKQRRPEEIIIGGSSAGANLTAALILRARDAGLPLPAGAILHTPGLDMTGEGDSRIVNSGVDAVLPASSGAMLQLYIGGADAHDPYVSPIYGDVAKGFPPSFLSAGTRDLLLSDAVRMHNKLRAADIDAELHVIEAGSHGGFHGAPEEHHINREVRKFMRRVWRMAERWP